jgi:formylglycine-generating enzyme required for sulfatase activity
MDIHTGARVPEDGLGMTLNAPRVLRGGSWNNNPVNCRSANRNRNAPDNRNNNNGFRVVLHSYRPAFGP